MITAAPYLGYRHPARAAADETATLPEYDRAVMLKYCPDFAETAAAWRWVRALPVSAAARAFVIACNLADALSRVLALFLAPQLARLLILPPWPVLILTAGPARCGWSPGRSRDRMRHGPPIPDRETPRTGTAGRPKP